jgi:hypothetical protein
VGVKKQCDKLKSNLLDIQSVLEDADRKQVKDKAVRDWLDKLKDACYDMDDVLDEWKHCNSSMENGGSCRKYSQPTEDTVFLPGISLLLFQSSGSTSRHCPEDQRS